MRTYFLVHVCRPLSQSSLQHVIAFVPWILSFASLHRALEVEPDAVDGLGGEADLISFEIACLEELIEERALVALAVSISRDESRQVNSIFDGHLHKFAFFQEGVHPRIICARLRVFGRSGGHGRRRMCRL